MAYTWLLFDLDNTLFDFTASSNEALKEFAALLNVEYNSEFLDIYHEINHGVWTEFENGLIDSMTLRRKRFEMTASHYGITLDGLMVNRKYLKSLVKHVHYIPYSRELLDKLKGNYKLGAITNGLKEVQRPRLKAAKMYDYFDVIVVSDEIGIAKPDKRYFQYVWDKMGNPPKEDVLVVGDNPSSDIVGANNFGFNSCLFDPKEKYNDVECTFRIKRLEDFYEIISS